MRQIMSRIVKAVFFDLDGTLRIVTPTSSNAFIRWGRETGFCPMTDAEAKQFKLDLHYYWGAPTFQVDKDMERLGRKNFWPFYYERMMRMAGIEEKWVKETAVSYQSWSRQNKSDVSLVEGGLETLTSLKKSGYKLGLLSNREETLHHLVTALELDDIFDVVKSAGEYGVWKPHPQIFANFINEFEDLTASDCVYIGDNYFADGEGAKKAGLTPILYDPEKLYEDKEMMRITKMSQLSKAINKIAHSNNKKKKARNRQSKK